MNHGNVSQQIAAGLLTLQERIEAAKIPSSKIDETLNIATWNIREFGKKARSEAAIHYIAEIIGQFDLVGVVELRDNLSDLGRVLPVLGPYWRAVYSDMIPDAGGNRERIAYVYDKRAVVFNGLAAEANAPRKKQGLEYLAERDFWRAPYIASFRSGNFDFVVLSVHVRWGDSTEARRQELEMLADWIEGRRQDKCCEDEDLIVLGDFNIPSQQDSLFKAITKHGLQIPRALVGVEHGSNLEKNKRYDQILHCAAYPDNFTNCGGVLDFFIDENGIEGLFPGGMTKAQFTYQMSDHLPLWMQMNTDIDGQQLQQIVRG
jgi:endonuclease/exonuclease/phosphatase family metal-dependent hydrolase